MDHPLLSVSQISQKTQRVPKTVTFRQCLRLTNNNGRDRYQKHLFLLMSAYWIFASLFISMQFFLYKRPQYCQYINGKKSLCCHEGDKLCIQQICNKYFQIDMIRQHIIPDRSLSYNFELFCIHDNIRFYLKMAPQVLPFFGYLFYGFLADKKGRKTAINITWRMYTLGVVIYAITASTYFKILGYLIASTHCMPSLILQFVLFFQGNIQKSRNRTCLLLVTCLFIGPLIVSLSSSIINKIDNRIVLLTFCAIPAVILSFTVNKLNQSAIYVYPFDKMTAFNILNNVAHQLQIQPILIDLSKSHWRKYIQRPNLTYFQILNLKQINYKVILGFFFMFANFYNMKMVQITLDVYTVAGARWFLITLPMMIADLTVIGFMVLTLCPQVMKPLAIVISFLLRYFYQICYCIVLIWAIQSFPTTIRCSCASFVMAGGTLGVFLAYFLKFNPFISVIIAIFSTIAMFLSQKKLQLHRHGIMLDTINGNFYDQNDKFYQI